MLHFISGWVEKGKFRLFRAATIIAHLHKSRHLHRRNNQSNVEYKFKLAAKKKIRQFSFGE